MNRDRQDLERAQLERERQLHAYFDGELSNAERAEIESQLATDPELRTSRTELTLLREVVVASLDAEGAGVPDARFEQIWDEVERTLDRDVRLQQAADTNVSIWSRLASFMRPLWAPAAATAAVAAAVLIYVQSGGEGDANKPAQVASKDPPAPPVVAAPEPPARGEDGGSAVIAFEMPNNNEAEIQRIEFGGKSGRIDRIEGKQAVTTVIWVTEEDETSDSERSL